DAAKSAKPSMRPSSALEAPATVVKNTANTEKIISELISVRKLTKPSLSTSGCRANEVRSMTELDLSVEACSTSTSALICDWVESLIHRPIYENTACLHRYLRLSSRLRSRQARVDPTENVRHEQFLVDVIQQVVKVAFVKFNRFVSRPGGVIEELAPTE